ncbi:2-C-methyl-D-erythritol 4-phosphate cytidylyltransferase [Moraxella sp. RCAD0137]|uniref:2-C-methyl-D-erythritol 4-phosphate cytidylyltransferase n=1 Tax=Moraxella sp. RCAD0137 TaxID=1775913 RepID=UPI000C9F677A|nr:2-C-methyl-D-erythritol 4-phosphate cytidylyltransferase [Moraxella sp. RCAD0137]PNP99211.1 2-C-methyl-D-erythritol 4-phosphate cytidylyltransferase [Moraxella sp. RCAD0137]
MSTIYPLIVAAGTGSRFGGDLPKQYLRILNKSILAHSVERLNHPALSALTLVVSAQDVWIKDAYVDIEASYSLPIHLAIGGAERWQSVMNGLNSICQLGAKADDWVLIHDAARPCLPRSDLQKIIDKIHSNDACAIILASAVVDTLKYAKDGRISHTVDRENLWQSLTPQAFQIKTLKAAFDYVMTNDIHITDEAAACEAMGVAVDIIAASRMNIKLTYPEDLPLIQALITQSDA